MADDKLWIYEVNVKVDLSIENEYRAEVQDHINRITALPGFKGARWMEQHDNPNTYEERSWVIQYYAESHEAIENYFNTLAPELRAGTQKFGSKVQASRRVLKPFTSLVSP
jgi:hypothetical protein